MAEIGSPQLLAGKVAIVTGAASGQGLAEARLFAAAGAAVVLTDVNEAGAVHAASIENATFERRDVADADDWAELIARTLARLGRVDVLVNNAGVEGPGSIHDLDMEHYARVIAVDQTGPLLGMRAVIPAMTRGGGGSIINISSTAGLAAAAGIIPYVAAKWALRGMTKGVALEVAGANIRVNSVHPGRIDTPLLARVAGTGPALANRIPVGRVGAADEVAQLALFLASDLSSYCTGAEFVIDGGQVAQLP